MFLSHELYRGIAFFPKHDDDDAQYILMPRFQRRPCTNCTKMVYPADKYFSHRENIWHFKCFICSAPTCNTKLSLSTVVYENGNPYCPKCNSQTMHKKSATMIKKMDFSGENAEQIETWSPSQPQKNSLIASLPQELLLKVLQYLAQPEYLNPGGWKAFLTVSESCKYLYSISWDPSLPRVLTLPNILQGGLKTQIPGIGTTTPIPAVSFPVKIEKDPSFPTFRDLFIKTATHIRINVWKHSKFNDIVLPTLKSIGVQPTVTSFDFTGSSPKLGPQHFSELLKSFPNVIKADFRGCHGIRRNIFSLTSFPKTIRYLNLSGKPCINANRLCLDSLSYAPFLPFLTDFIANYQVLCLSDPLEMPKLTLFCNLHTSRLVNPNYRPDLNPRFGDHASLSLLNLLKGSPYLTELSFPKLQFSPDDLFNLLEHASIKASKSEHSLLSSLEVVRSSRTFTSDHRTDYVVRDKAAKLLLSAPKLHTFDAPLSLEAIRTLIPRHKHFCSNVTFLNLIHACITLDDWTTIDASCPNLRQIIINPTPLLSHDPRGNTDHSVVPTALHLWNKPQPQTDTSISTNSNSLISFGLLSSPSFCKKACLSFLYRYFLFHSPFPQPRYHWVEFLAKLREAPKPAYRYTYGSSLRAPNVPDSHLLRIRDAISGTTHPRFQQLLKSFTDSLFTLLRIIKKTIIFSLFANLHTEELKRQHFFQNHLQTNERIKTVLSDLFPLLHCLGYSHTVFDALIPSNVSHFLSPHIIDHIKSIPIYSIQPDFIPPEFPSKIESLKKYFPKVYSDQDPIRQFMDKRISVRNHTDQDVDVNDNTIAIATTSPETETHDSTSTATTSSQEGEELQNDLGFAPQLSVPSSIIGTDDDFSIDAPPSPMPSPRNESLDNVADDGIDDTQTFSKS